MADPQFVYLPAPHEGLDLSVAPHQLPPTRSPYIENYLVHEENRVILRGPAEYAARGQFDQNVFRDTGDTTTAVNPNITAAVPLADVILLNHVDTSATLGWWPWRVFDAAAPATETLKPRGLLASFNPNTLTFAKKTGTGAGMNPAHAVQHLGYVFFISLDGSNVISYLAKQHTPTAVIRAGPTLSDAITAGTAISSPRACQGIASYAERLWMLGGIAASATADTVVGGVITNKSLAPNTLWFTNAGADPLILSSWQTTSGGSTLSNQIAIGGDSTTDFGIGLASAGRYLVIFKRRSVWTLTGTGTDSFSVRQISGTIGCVDPRSILVVDDTVYWLSAQGMMMYDGSAIQNMSARVQRPLRSALRTYGAPSAGANSFAELTDMGNGYIGVTVGARPESASFITAATAFCALFHVATQRWTYFTTQAWTGNWKASITVDVPGGLDRVVASAGRYYHFDQDKAFDVTYVTDPYQADAEPSADAYAWGRDADVDGPTTFNAAVQVPPLRGASPARLLQLKRVGLERYEQHGASLADIQLIGQQQLTVERYARDDARDAVAGGPFGPWVDLASVNAIDHRARINWAELRTEARDIIIRSDRSQEGGRVDTLGTQPSAGNWTVVLGAFANIAVTGATRWVSSGVNLTTRNLFARNVGTSPYIPSTDNLQILNWTAGTVPPAGSNSEVIILLKWIDNQNYVYARGSVSVVTGLANIIITQVVAGVTSTVASGATTFTPVTAGTYYLVARVMGNAVRAWFMVSGVATRANIAPERRQIIGAQFGGGPMGYTIAGDIVSGAIDPAIGSGHPGYPGVGILPVDTGTALEAWWYYPAPPRKGKRFEILGMLAEIQAPTQETRN